MQVLPVVAMSLVMALLLSACQSSSSYSVNTYDKRQALYLDEYFSGYESVDIESEQKIFAVDDDMREMVLKKLSPEINVRKKATKLLEQIFDTGQADLAYKSGANVIAADAFHNKEANCLSLTIMAYALAKEAGLNVKFQDVKIPEYWVRNRHLNMLTGHVNLRVVESKLTGTMIFLDRNIIEIDFDPYVVKKSFPKKDIRKNTVMAMFYNNKGANAMVNKDFITAYAYLKSATITDPNFSPAWGNLAILYRFNGFEQQAIDGYRFTLAIDRNNLTAMSNLSLVLHKQGKLEEAKEFDRIIEKRRANNPYYYALLGDEKFYNGFYHESISHYRKAIRLDENIHEFYFGLAKAYFKLDDFEKAQRYLERAMAKSKVDSIDQQYLAKLNVLSELGAAK